MTVFVQTGFFNDCPVEMHITISDDPGGQDPGATGR
jgi:hypothetical protein